MKNAAGVRSVLLALLFCVLALHTFYKGVLPAWRAVDSDFPNYYVSARIVLEGRDPARLYDDTWFQRQIYDYGIHQLGKFSPFPPATALVLLPLAHLSPLAALRVATSLNLLLLAGSAVLLARLVRASLLEAAVFVLLSGMGLVNCIRLGQLYIAVSFLLLLGIYCLAQKKEFIAGIWLALPVPIKYYPSLFIAYYALKGRWKMALASAAVVAIAFGVGIALLGWPLHVEYILSVFPEHLQSQLSHQDPFSPAFQSIDSLFRRLFVYDANRNPNPLVQAAIFYPMLKWLIIGLLTAALAHGVHRMERSAAPAREPLSVALLGIWGLLIAPATATYHFLLLWLPVGCLLSHLRESGSRRLFGLGIGAQIGIGFLPYSRFVYSGDRGLLMLAEYPRLWFTLVLFLVALAAASQASRPRSN